MMPWNLLGMALKTGAKLYSDKQKTKEALSEARLLHAEKMKRGDIEYQGKLLDHQKGDWKDEFVLLTVSSPLFLLAYSVFAEDEDIQNKIDLYFEKLQQMPWWLVSLWISIVAAIYGIKATDLVKKK
jgi:hypothetical protein